MNLKSQMLTELNHLKKEKNQLIMPLFVTCVIVILIIFGTSDKTQASDSPFARLENLIATDPIYQQPFRFYDLDKLAEAVSMHETANCTLGYGKTHNNATGIRRKGKFVRYTSCAESKEDFKRTWERYYGRFPTLSDAKRWSGNDRPATWLRNVTYHYNKAL